MTMIINKINIEKLHVHPLFSNPMQLISENKCPGDPAFNTIF